MDKVNRGDVLSRRMRYGDAEQVLKEAADELETIAAADPDNTAATRDHAVSLSLLGVALSGSDRHAEARDAVERSLKLRERIASRSPDNPLTIFDIYPICVLLALIENRMERFDEAGKWMERIGEPVRHGAIRRSRKVDGTDRRTRATIRGREEIAARSTAVSPQRGGTLPYRDSACEACHGGSECRRRATRGSRTAALGPACDVTRSTGQAR
jgi:hypothetical protein